jgi:Rhodopirellula transposase DDE domain
VIAAIRDLLQHDTAGDPISGIQWTRRTTYKIAEQLQQLGLDLCPNTVAKLLKNLGFSLRVNHKQLAGEQSPDRDQQFQYMAQLRTQFTSQGWPIISVDTKKRELIGNFKNPGKTWEQEPLRVRSHDFPSAAHGVAIPYGIYDLQAHRGSVFVGTSYDTPDFAVGSIEKWWRYEGAKRYPKVPELLILADSGGSNGVRQRAWKSSLQSTFCDRHHLCVTVSHYPTGTSKWNPIEHRLFSEISRNWAGQPLVSYETMLNYIRTTKTTTGLTVEAYLVEQQYAKGIKISNQEMKQLKLDQHEILPRWNYTLRPR